ncbi:aminomethyltransferase [Amylibacter kogurei]|uniref:Aminomethyltransferase n=1 Tax=Paramylibacter kogurei TaxID=1889778 RepID=A0A2G5K1X7_9RHOB|nr:folate-binding protein YgfZ [Amylibacter kogurei]PIB23511.1 aminomethyltransferase [Amylibacter kogurei]
MTGELAIDRGILRISGSDAYKFLQDTISNDMGGTKKGLVYASILTPQGKYLFDFFVAANGDDYLIDIAVDRAPALAKRLTMYKLRADVQIEATDLCVNRGLGDVPSGAHADPRHADLGWRQYSATKGGEPTIDWTAIRVKHCIPETNIELIADETYILEAGFERLHGVDFRKGCYVGQEVTARMKHKTELRKGFKTVAIDGTVPIGSAITRDGKSIGQVFSQSNGQAIAYLRFDRAGDGMESQGVAIRLL